MKKFNEHGRSMIEMLGVLTIIGVLSAGGLAGYAKAMFRHRLNTTMDQITMLTTNIRTMYGAQTDYAGLTKDAMSLNLIPTAMVPAGSSVDGTSSMLTLMSPFKGKVEIQTSSVYGHNGTQNNSDSAFVIAYYNLPRDACVALASADFGSGAGSGFIGVMVHGEGVELSAGTGTAHDAAVGDGIESTSGERQEGAPYKVTDALEECNVTNDNSVVSWKFY